MALSLVEESVYWTRQRWLVIYSKPYDGKHCYGHVYQTAPLNMHITFWPLRLPGRTPESRLELIMNKSVRNQPVSHHSRTIYCKQKKSLSSPFHSTPVHSLVPRPSFRISGRVWERDYPVHWSSDIKIPFSKGLTLVIRILGTPGSDAEQSPARKYLSVAPVWLVCRSTHKYV